MIKIDLIKKIALSIKSPRTARNALFDSLFQVKKTIFPRIIDIFVTERCNFSCPMCHVGESMIKNYSQSDISLDSIRKILLESKKWGSSFQIAGGEPTLYSHLIETLRLISSHNLISGLTTNGQLLGGMAREIVYSGLNFLAISLDGWDEPSQKMRSNVSGSFEKIVDGVRQVLLFRDKRIFPIVRIATVITRHNCKDLDKIARIVMDLKVEKWSISNHYFVTNNVIEKNNRFRQETGIGDDIWAHKISGKSYFSQEEAKHLNEALAGLKKKYNSRITIDYNWPINLEKFYSDVSPSMKSKCLLPYRELVIRGNGDLELCQGFKLGNIKTDTIYGAWNSDKAEYFRSIFRKKNGIMPACFRCCALDIKFD